MSGCQNVHEYKQAKKEARCKDNKELKIKQNSPSNAWNVARLYIIIKSQQRPKKK
jgi:hypothetical protein